MINPWDKIFLGEFEAALQIADENYKVKEDDFSLRARALAFLHLRDYSNSLQDFELLKERERQNNRVSDSTYLYIGLCYYALGLQSEAKMCFEYPIKSSKEFKYTTDISLAPAIFYYFSLKLEDLKLIALAEKVLLKKKTPIAELLTGQLSEKEFDNEFILSELNNRRECRAEFYKGIIDLKNKDYQSFKNHLLTCKDLKGQYLELEYYFAKVELEKH